MNLEFEDGRCDCGVGDGGEVEGAMKLDLVFEFLGEFPSDTVLVG